jgi:hypothetical protein
MSGLYIVVGVRIAEMCSFLGKQKRQKGGKKNKKESSCSSLQFLALFASLRKNAYA